MLAVYNNENNHMELQWRALKKNLVYTLNGDIAKIFNGYFVICRKLKGNM